MADWVADGEGPELVVVEGLEAEEGEEGLDVVGSVLEGRRRQAPPALPLQVSAPSPLSARHTSFIAQHPCPRTGYHVGTHVRVWGLKFGICGVYPV